MAKRPSAKPSNPDDDAPSKRPAPGRNPGATPGELGPGCRIALLIGKEAYLRQAYTDHLRTAIEAAGTPVDILRFDGATASVADVLDECRCMGLMAQHKLVVVDEADDFVKEDHRPLIERYAQSPAEGATLVLRSETWRKGKLDAMIEKVGVIKACELTSSGQAMKWAVKVAQERHGVNLEPDAAEQLIDRVGADLGRLSTELAKLAPGAGAGGSITAEMVASLVSRAAGDEKPWAIQDLLLNPDPQPALKKLHEMIELSRVDPVPLRWAYADLARKLHSLSAEIHQGVPAHAAGKSLRLWGPAVGAIRSLAARTSPAILADLLHAAVETDVRGKTSQGDPVRDLELLTLRFASVARA